MEIVLLRKGLHCKYTYLSAGGAIGKPTEPPDDTHIDHRVAQLTSNDTPRCRKNTGLVSAGVDLERFREVTSCVLFVSSLFFSFPHFSQDDVNGPLLLQPFVKLQ